MRKGGEIHAIYQCDPVLVCRNDGGVLGALRSPHALPFASAWGHCCGLLGRSWAPGALPRSCCLGAGHVSPGHDLETAHSTPFIERDILLPPQWGMQREHIMDPNVASDLSRRAQRVCYSPRAYLALSIDLLLDLSKCDYAALEPDEIARRLDPYLYLEDEADATYEPFHPACRAAGYMPVMQLCANGHMHDLYARIFGSGDAKFYRRPSWAEEVKGFPVTALARAFRKAAPAIYGE